MISTDIKVYIDKDQGRNVPFFACEICGEKIIQKEENGMIFWNDKKGVLAHKSCMQNHPDDKSYPSSEELESFFFNTLHNSKIIPKEDEFSV